MIKPTDGVAFANSSQLAALAEYLDKMTETARTTGWHVDATVLTFGEVKEEQILIGIRWMGDQYLAEIR